MRDTEKPGLDDPLFFLVYREGRGDRDAVFVARSITTGHVSIGSTRGDADRYATLYFSQVRERGVETVHAAGQTAHVSTAA